MVLVLSLWLVRAMSHVVSVSSWHGSLTFRIRVIFRPRERRVSGVSLGLLSDGGLAVLFWGGGMVGGGEWVFDMFLGDLDGSPRGVFLRMLFVWLYVVIQS